ncbi:hypothetical protein BCR44DRAFT_1439960 [Catenaria anguillulae PL171]|uniref:Uncharacterized protein n=1 Tax=Catenaria anguillulae PL171 TaxID=765915 RepID=A0A1Y2HDH3_9FUNG|nr:hypothetical protein BCR44DRAFT_1439960 [Catenaria anguillulae PL171]
MSNAKKGGFADWAHFQGIGAGAGSVHSFISCPSESIMALTPLHFQPNSPCVRWPICYFYPRWYLGPYGLALGLIVMALEWPLVNPASLGAFYSNYSIRGLLYVVLSAACYLQAALFNGGNFLTFCGLTYLVASFRGESWKPPRGRGGARPAPPPARAQGEKR